MYSVIATGPELYWIVVESVYDRSIVAVMLVLCQQFQQLPISVLFGPHSSSCRQSS